MSSFWVIEGITSDYIYSVLEKAFSKCIPSSSLTDKSTRGRGGGVEGFGIRLESQSQLENLAHERGMLDADIRKKRRVERTK